MANRRMVHKSISVDKDVNSLSDFAGLLCTWIIPHLDDFGKIEGDATVIKALVIPLRPQSIEETEKALQEILKQVRGIERYEIDGKMVLKYKNFDEYQVGLNKRTKSKLPDNPRSTKSYLEVPIISKPNEWNPNEPKSREENLISNTSKNKIPFKGIRKIAEIISPHDFEPSNEGEAAAKYAFLKLEPENPVAFKTTYLWAYKQGLPAHLFYQFVSEIKDSPNVLKPGAIFRKKVDEYLKARTLS